MESGGMPRELSLGSRDCCALRAVYVLLCSYVVHLNQWSLIRRERVHCFVKFIVTMDTGDIKSTLLVGFYQLFHTHFVYGCHGFPDILSGPVVQVVRDRGQNFIEFTVMPSNDTLRSCCISSSSSGIATVLSTTVMGFRLVVFPLIPLMSGP
jgi:hypothetical protein